jgi:hypothetical protein
MEERGDTSLVNKNKITECVFDYLKKFYKLVKTDVSKYRYDPFSRYYYNVFNHEVFYPFRKCMDRYEKYGAYFVEFWTCRVNWDKIPALLLYYVIDHGVCDEVSNSINNLTRNYLAPNVQVAFYGVNYAVDDFIPDCAIFPWLDDHDNVAPILYTLPKKYLHKSVVVHCPGSSSTKVVINKSGEQRVISHEFSSVHANKTPIIAHLTGVPYNLEDLAISSYGNVDDFDLLFNEKRYVDLQNEKPIFWLLWYDDRFSAGCRPTLGDDSPTTGIESIKELKGSDLYMMTKALSHNIFLPKIANYLSAIKKTKARQQIASKLPDSSSKSSAYFLPLVLGAFNNKRDGLEIYLIIVGFVMYRGGTEDIKSADRYEREEIWNIYDMDQVPYRFIKKDCFLVRWDSITVPFITLPMKIQPMVKKHEELLDEIFCLLELQRLKEKTGLFDSR